ncbi:MAG: hypothetical protein RSC08_03615 [Oscillospiraceae bacterium]
MAGFSSTSVKVVTCCAISCAQVPSSGRKVPSDATAPAVTVTAAAAERATNCMARWLTGGVCPVFFRCFPPSSRSSAADAPPCSR